MPSGPVRISDHGIAVVLILEAEPEMDFVIFNADGPSSIQHEIEVIDCSCQVRNSPQQMVLYDKLGYPLIFGMGTVCVVRHNLVDPGDGCFADFAVSGALHSSNDYSERGIHLCRVRGVVSFAHQVSVRCSEVPFCA
jgi:hypothetical protein